MSESLMTTTEDENVKTMIAHMTLHFISARHIKGRIARFTTDPLMELEYDGNLTNNEVKTKVDEIIQRALEVDAVPLRRYLLSHPLTVHLRETLFHIIERIKPSIKYPLFSYDQLLPYPNAEQYCTEILEQKKGLIAKYWETYNPVYTPEKYYRTYHLSALGSHFKEEGGKKRPVVLLTNGKGFLKLQLIELDHLDEVEKLNDGDPADDDGTGNEGWTRNTEIRIRLRGQILTLDAYLSVISKGSQYTAKTVGFDNRTRKDTAADIARAFKYVFMYQAYAFYEALEALFLMFRMIDDDATFATEQNSAQHLKKDDSADEEGDEDEDEDEDEEEDEEDEEEEEDEEDEEDEEEEEEENELSDEAERKETEGEDEETNLTKFTEAAFHEILHVQTHSSFGLIHASYNDFHAPILEMREMIEKIMTGPENPLEPVFMVIKKESGSYLCMLTGTNLETHVSAWTGELVLHVDPKPRGALKTANVLSLIGTDYELYSNLCKVFNYKHDDVIKMLVGHNAGVDSVQKGRELLRGFLAGSHGKMHLAPGISISLENGQVSVANANASPIGLLKILQKKLEHNRDPSSAKDEKMYLESNYAAFSVSKKAKSDKFVSGMQRKRDINKVEAYPQIIYEHQTLRLPDIHQVIGSRDRIALFLSLSESVSTNPPLKNVQTCASAHDDCDTMSVMRYLVEHQQSGEEKITLLQLVPSDAEEINDLDLENYIKYLNVFSAESTRTGQTFVVKLSVANNEALVSEIGGYTVLIFGDSQYVGICIREITSFLDRKGKGLQQVKTNELTLREAYNVMLNDRKDLHGKSLLISCAQRHGVLLAIAREVDYSVSITMELYDYIVDRVFQRYRLANNELNDEQHVMLPTRVLKFYAEGTRSVFTDFIKFDKSAVDEVFGFLLRDSNKFGQVTFDYNLHYPEGTEMRHATIKSSVLLNAELKDDLESAAKEFKTMLSNICSFTYEIENKNEIEKINGVVQRLQEFFNPLAVSQTKYRGHNSMRTMVQVDVQFKERVLVARVKEWLNHLDGLEGLSRKGPDVDLLHTDFTDVSFAFKQLQGKVNEAIQRHVHLQGSPAFTQPSPRVIAVLDNAAPQEPVSESFVKQSLNALNKSEDDKRHFVDAAIGAVASVRNPSVVCDNILSAHMEDVSFILDNLEMLELTDPKPIDEENYRESFVSHHRSALLRDGEKEMIEALRSIDSYFTEMGRSILFESDFSSARLKNKFKMTCAFIDHFYLWLKPTEETDKLARINMHVNDWTIFGEERVQDRIHKKEEQKLAVLYGYGKKSADAVQQDDEVLEVLEQEKNAEAEDSEELYDSEDDNSESAVEDESETNTYDDADLNMLLDLDYDIQTRDLPALKFAIAHAGENNANETVKKAKRVFRQLEERQRVERDEIVEELNMGKNVEHGFDVIDCVTDDDVHGRLLNACLYQLKRTHIFEYELRLGLGMPRMAVLLLTKGNLSTGQTADYTQFGVCTHEHAAWDRFHVISQAIGAYCAKVVNADAFYKISNSAQDYFDPDDGEEDGEDEDYAN